MTAPQSEVQVVVAAAPNDPGHGRRISGWLRDEGYAVAVDTYGPNERFLDELRRLYDVAPSIWMIISRPYPEFFPDQWGEMGPLLGVVMEPVEVGDGPLILHLAGLDEVEQRRLLLERAVAFGQPPAAESTSGAESSASRWTTRSATSSAADGATKSARLQEATPGGGSSDVEPSAVEQADAPGLVYLESLGSQWWGPAALITGGLVLAPTERWGTQPSLTATAPRSDTSVEALRVDGHPAEAQGLVAFRLKSPLPVEELALPDEPRTGGGVTLTSFDGSTVWQTSGIVTGVDDGRLVIEVSEHPALEVGAIVSGSGLSLDGVVVDTSSNDRVLAAPTTSDIVVTDAGDSAATTVVGFPADMAAASATFVVGWTPDPDRRDEQPDVSGADFTEVRPGDRIYVMRAADPVGLVARGTLRDGPPQTSLGAVEWTTRERLPVFAREELVERYGESDAWSATAAFPVGLPHELAEPLNDDWTVREENERRGFRAPRASEAWIQADAVGRRPSEHDSLKAGDQAKVFATLLIAEDVKPPFAIGLLGDWGVGKSFFMRLMQEHVDDIAGPGRPRTPGSVRRAAQIEFNAWHYVDSDLWASLASHIFDSLAAERGGDESAPEKARRELRRSIHSSESEKNEAEATIKRAAESRVEATSRLAMLAADRDVEAAKREPMRLARVWQAVLKVRPDPHRPETANWPDLDEAKEKAESKAKHLGITKAIDSAEEAERVYAEMVAVRERGAGLAASMRADFSGRSAWCAWLTVTVMIAVVVAWPWLLHQLDSLFKLEGSAQASRLAPVASVVTVVGVAVGWTGRSVSAVSSAIGYLEALRCEIHQPRVELEAPGEEEQELVKAIEELDSDIVVAQGRIDRADQQIASAQAEIQRINAGGLVYDFLEGRVRASEYTDRLGLISVIRKDFEQLGKLLADWWRHADDESPATPDPRDGPPIERIILYIDDLDRCPPGRVVEVLQAVHLLLAFDLFVVVVAVDARWLERSLNEAYNPWTAATNGRPREQMHRFDPHNYLEKIFQIPFNLPAMDADGYRALVEDMATAPANAGDENEEGGEGQVTASIATPAGQPENGETVLDGTAGSGQLRSGPEAPADAPSTPIPAAVLAPDGLAADPAQADPEDRPADEPATTLSELDRDEAEARVAATTVSDEEIQFIGAFHEFVRTPRLAKRLLNIYRLLRVQATATKPDGPTADAGDDYRAMVATLAIGIGYAEVAPTLLEELSKSTDSGSFYTWLRNRAEDFEKRRAEFEARRDEESQRSPGATVSTSSEEARNLARLAASTKRIVGHLDAVRAELHRTSAPPFDDRLPNYRRWASTVGRYSFGWHMKLDASTDPSAAD